MIRDPFRIILLAPAVFLLHVTEEAPGFVTWFNARVQPSITQRYFVAVNVGVFFITALMSTAMFVSRDRIVAFAAVAWLSFFMLTNGIFHIIGAIVQPPYAPGVITATLLYIPYFLWFAILLVRGGHVSLPRVVAAIVVGGLPMAAHGYLVVFEGRRLF